MVYEHGGDVYRNKVRLDFSVNTNPLGMSENVKKAIAENIEQFGIYPDAMCVNLRNAIAEKEQVGADNVLCSNGAAEMIFAVVRAVMPKKTLLLAPTFSEYERALKSVGSQICYYYLKEKNDFELQDDFIDYLDDIEKNKVLSDLFNNISILFCSYDLNKYDFEKKKTIRNNINYARCMEKYFNENNMYSESNSILKEIIVEMISYYANYKEFDTIDISLRGR